MASLLDINWENEFRDCNAQEAMDQLEKKYNDAIEECVPKTTIHDHSVVVKPSWLTNHALRKVKRKHSAWIRYLNTKAGKDYL